MYINTISETIVKVRYCWTFFHTVHMKTEDALYTTRGDKTSEYWASCVCDWIPGTAWEQCRLDQQQPQTMDLFIVFDYV